jgi:hypothetical protein
MTIKLPVAADLLETDARLAWRIVDADGVVIPWGTVVAALNATATPAPDLTALEQAVEAARASLARGDSEMEVTAKYLDIVDAAAALCPPKDGTP